MSRMRCTCPACDTVVKLDDESAAGTKITCPECSAVFRVPEADEEAVGEERERRLRRRKRPAPTGMKPAVLLLILVPVILGVVGLAAGGGWVAWRYLTPEKDVASATPSINNAVNPPFPIGQAPNANPPNPGPGPAAGAIRVGTVAPEIEGDDLDGHHFKLSDYRGKVVVLDFWGHW